MLTRRVLRRPQGPRRADGGALSARLDAPAGVRSVRHRASEGRGFAVGEGVLLADAS